MAGELRDSGRQSAWPTHLAGGPDDDYRKRLEVAYLVASVGLIVIGVFWLGWFVWESRWDLVTLDLIYVGIGAYLLSRIRTRGLYLAAMLCQVMLFFMLVAICVAFDVPDTIAPRVTHVYFLALAFLAYVTFRHVSRPMTNLLVGLYLGAFIVFASTNFGYEMADPLPERVRVAGSWINSVVAVAIMCGCMYILNSDFAARSRLGRQLTAALAQNQFELYYQPQVDSEGTVKGAEALLRWNHPKRGQVPPGEFIPAAEQLGVMKPIGSWVLNSACARLAQWKGEPDKAGLRLAVNVSPQQFHDEDFVDEVKQTVEQHGIDPARLELELTESIVIGDVEDVIGKMQSLAAFGIALSLDDFGTGYSSLKYLKRMPFSQLKIDQSFVRDMLDDDRNAAIVRGIIQLGRELHLSVIAEGVETAEQQQFLLAQGCTEFQGYLFGRPVPAGEFLRTA